MRITRQSDYYGLDRYSAVPGDVAPPATKPPAGLEQMLKYKSVTPGTMLHQVNDAMSGSMSQDTGQDRWPAVLPGDQLVNAVGGAESKVKGILPTVVKPPKAKPPGVSKVPPVAKPAGVPAVAMVWPPRVAGAPSENTGPDGWPAELPGDQILDQVDNLKDNLSEILE